MRATNQTLTISSLSIHILPSIARSANPQHDHIQRDQIKLQKCRIHRRHTQDTQQEEEENYKKKTELIQTIPEFDPEKRHEAKGKLFINDKTG